MPLVLAGQPDLDFRADLELVRVEQAEQHLLAQAGLVVDVEQTNSKRRRLAQVLLDADVDNLPQLGRPQIGPTELDRDSRSLRTEVTHLRHTTPPGLCCRPSARALSRCPRTDAPLPCCT